MRVVFKLTLFLCLLPVGQPLAEKAPDGFVYINKIDPTLIENPRYVGSDNFLGRPVPGYCAPHIISTKQAALALKAAHDDFKKLGYLLVIYDAYRPQMAVDEFMKWGKDQKDDVARSRYYPTLTKKQVFDGKYVAEKSSHSRGSTFDLTLIEANKKLSKIRVSQRKLKNGEIIPFLDDNTLDMGASFDLFHPSSHHDSPLVAQKYTERRNLLRRIMKKHGFNHYPEEWWHYTLNDEPYKDQYFGFVKLGE